MIDRTVWQHGILGVLILLVGALGCGHCAYHVTNECAPALKTADGTIYVLESETEQDKLMGDRFSGKEITVSGTVKKVDGQLVLHTAMIEVP